MAGHGSPPPEDRANHPNRKVGRNSRINWWTGDIEDRGPSTQGGSETWVPRPEPGSRTRFRSQWER